MISAQLGVRVYLACGTTDMRRVSFADIPPGDRCAMGMDGLAMVVQQTLAGDPFGGAVYAFRGRRGSLLKLLWHDGIGLCPLAKRLERGHFVWPMTSTGAGVQPQARVGGLIARGRGAKLTDGRRGHGGIEHGAPVQIDLDMLPDDTAALQQMLRDVVAAAHQQQAALQSAVQEREAENDKLRLLIQRLMRNQFGRRSERLDPDQLQLGLEDLEQAIAEGEAAQDAAAQSDEQRQQRHAARPRRNHGALPAHLPRYEILIDVEDKACPCCAGTLHLIGEDQAEQLDIVPAQLRVRVIRRPRYGCRICEGTVVRALAPDRPIDGGMATEAWWRTSWSPSSATICRSTARPGCWRDRA